MKAVISKTILASVFLASVSFAAQSLPMQNTQYTLSGAKHPSMTVAPGDTNCYYHASDVCVYNYSSQTINIYTPLRNATYFASNAVDIWSNNYYPGFQVTITNSCGQPIFNQGVNNHSVINVFNGAKLAGTGKTQLKVTVTH